MFYNFKTRIELNLKLLDNTGSVDDQETQDCFKMELTKNFKYFFLWQTKLTITIAMTKKIEIGMMI